MAFNWRTFRTRTLTAVVFVIVMLAGLLINHWTFFILFSIIHFGCWIEYQRLVGLIDPDYQKISTIHKYGVMLAGWSIMFLFTGLVYNIPGSDLNEAGLWLGSTSFAAVILSELFGKNKNPKLIAHSLLGLIYISLSLGFMIGLTNVNYNNPVLLKNGEHFHVIFIPLIIIGTMWVNDTMAYIVGSIIGKTPLSKVSPKKTIEGTIGGIILASLIMGHIGYVFDEWFMFNQSRIAWIILALLGAIAGTFGDLFESKLKRLAGVKDSGHLMPGHGGFLDRFDSLLFAVPAVWLYVYFVMS